MTEAEMEQAARDALVNIEKAAEEFSEVYSALPSESRLRVGGLVLGTVILDERLGTVMQIGPRMCIREIEENIEEAQVEKEREDLMERMMGGLSKLDNKNEMEA